ncbi:MAG: hypothetical protein V5A18_10045 [Haloarculaceae archaeon]
MTRQEATQRGVPELGDAPPKATLFCMDCGYSGHAGRDWCQPASGTIVCPTCGTKVTNRSPPPDTDAGTGIVQAWAGLVVASSMLGPRALRNWCAGTDLPGVWPVTGGDQR